MISIGLFFFSSKTKKVKWPRYLYSHRHWRQVDMNFLSVPGEGVSLLSAKKMCATAEEN